MSIYPLDKHEDILEVRECVLTGTKVIFSTERSRRPIEYAVGQRRAPADACPFCPGHEHETPPEISRRPSGESAQWNMRVVPNKFPALRREPAGARKNGELCPTMPGVGSHEVIIETPDHHRKFQDFSVSEIRDALSVYRERLNAMRETGGIRYTQIFKNHGPESGASLAHEHTQVLGLPTVPERVTRELERARTHFQKIR
ncbi:MAG: DUF4931 domain-containing protein [Deltaproteobacteria bacterium]|nr:DUF4931 domain-containing protein [Deltaproteobacteria bacterium]